MFDSPQVSQDSEAVKKVFGLEVGFFWETVETDETVHEQYFSGDLDLDTQNTMSLVYKKVFRTPCAMMGILNRVLQEGLDLWTVYQANEQLTGASLAGFLACLFRAKTY